MSDNKQQISTEQEALDRVAKENAKIREHYTGRSNIPEELRGKVTNPEMRSNAEDFFRMESTYNEMLKTVMSKNVCTKSEYLTKWMGMHQLFENSGFESVEEYKLHTNNLAQEYEQRFCVYYPISIRDDVDNTIELCRVPKLRSSVNMVTGPETMYIDQFIQLCNVDGRKDLANVANQGLLWAIQNAQNKSREAMEEERREAERDNISFLRVFAPNHPLLQQIDAQMSQMGEEKNVEEPTSKVLEKMIDDVNKPQELKLDTDDFFG